MAYSKNQTSHPEHEFSLIKIVSRNSFLIVSIVILASIIACVCAWWHLAAQKSDKTDSEPRRISPIAEVEPSLAGRAPIPLPVENNDPRKWPEKAPHPDGEWRHGEGPRSIAVTNGCLVTYPYYPKVQLILPHPHFAAPFETLLDNEIARLISAKPGDDFIDVPLPKNFDEKFADSILIPIEITDEDSKEKAELKRQVKEARKILVDAVKRGESPRDILTEEAKTLRRLMQTRDNYQRILNEQIENGASDQDINDTVNAANKMLEREGCAVKVILPWSTKLRIERAKAEGQVLD